jgi:hypothetical protein
MSWLSSFLNPGKGYEKGQEQLDKYYGQAQGALQPYNQNGQDQYANLQEMLKNLMDPQALQDKWASGYKESAAAKNAEGIAQEHGLDAASSMGLMGSNTALNAIQRGTSQIGADDKQNYLDQLMEKYKQAVGLSSGIYGQGANAAGIMSNNAMNMGQNSAEMAYGKQNAGGNMLSGLIGAGIGAAGSALGGPMGGAMGGALAKRWNLSGGA